MTRYYVTCLTSKNRPAYVSSTNTRGEFAATLVPSHFGATLYGTREEAESVREWCQTNNVGGSTYSVGQWA